MKNWAFVGLLAAIAAIWFVLSRTTESFVPEFLDQGNVKRTDQRKTSSYSQETNHFKMTPPPQDPIPGYQTPFRVNMYQSHME